MTLYLLFDSGAGQAALDSRFDLGPRRVAGRREARLASGLDNHGRRRHQGARHQVRQRHRRGSGRGDRGGTRRPSPAMMTAQGACARHDPAQSFATPRACRTTASQRRVTWRSWPRHPGPLPAALSAISPPDPSPIAAPWSSQPQPASGPVEGMDGIKTGYTAPPASTPLPPSSATGASSSPWSWAGVPLGRDGIMANMIEDTIEPGASTRGVAVITESPALEAVELRARPRSGKCCPAVSSAARLPPA